MEKAVDRKTVQLVVHICIANSIGKDKHTSRLIDNCVWTHVAGKHMHWACIKQTHPVDTLPEYKAHTAGSWSGKRNCRGKELLFVLFMYRTTCTLVDLPQWLIRVMWSSIIFHLWCSRKHSFLVLLHLWALIFSSFVRHWGLNLTVFFACSSFRFGAPLSFKF